MDATMRNLEQIQEIEPEGAQRRLGVFALATATTLVLVYSMGQWMASEDEPAPISDPLAALSEPSELTAEAAAADVTAAEPLAVDREALIFPETLVADHRPEVAAALAAAEAEHAALGTAAAPAPIPTQRAIPVATALPPATPTTLPAAVLATGEDIEVAASATRDTLVASSLPAESEPRGTVGMDGRFTLQVVSYRTREEADTFAEALRTRGHDAFVLNAEIEGRGRFYRVRVGPFENQREAEAYRRTFEQEEDMSTFLVKRRREQPRDND